MSNEMNEIIIVEQIPVIKERLETIKAEISERTIAAMALDCDESSYKAIKKIRADLTKEFKEWETRRKDVKNAVLTPYEAFEKIYKDCISDVFKEADADLKKKIDAVENTLKAEKKAKALEYFAEYSEAMGTSFLDFDNSGITISMSSSDKSIKTQIKTFIDRVYDDLEYIKEQENSAELAAEYKKSLNLTTALSSVAARHKAIEAEKKAAEERTRRAEQAAETEKQVDAVIAPVITPPSAKDPNEVLTLAFKVTATRSKLKELKNFLINGGYRYE